MGLLGGLGNIAGGLIGGLGSDLFSNVGSQMNDLISGSLSSALDFSSLSDFVYDVDFGDLASNVPTIIGDGLDAVNGVLENAASFVNDVAGNLTGVVDGVAGQFTDALGNVVDSAGGQFTGAIDNLTTGLSETARQNLHGLSNALVQEVKQKVTDTAGNLVNGVTSQINGKIENFAGGLTSNLTGSIIGSFTGTVSNIVSGCLPSTFDMNQLSRMQNMARRVALTVTIGGKEAAGGMAPSLLELSYTDNASGKADEIQISLEDRDGHWSGDWMPKKGMDVVVKIICINWQEMGNHIELPCGSFKIDEIECSGPPDKVSIKAVSASLNGPMRDSRKSRGWEKTSLRTIAGQIASENGLTLMYQGEDHQFERTDQSRESDISFLNHMAEDFGMNCKVHNGKLVLYDAEKVEAEKAAMDIPKKGNMYSPKSYSFKESSTDTGYAGATASYTDPGKGKTHRAVAISGRPETIVNKKPKILTDDGRSENPDHATKRARAKLHKKNTEEKTVSLSMLGCPTLTAGKSINLQDFGKFSGKYFIKTATHKIGGNGGYTTDLELTIGSPTKGVKAMDTL